MKIFVPYLGVRIRQQLLNECVKNDHIIPKLSYEIDMIETLV